LVHAVKPSVIDAHLHNAVCGRGCRSSLASATVSQRVERRSSPSCCRHATRVRMAYDARQQSSAPCTRQTNTPRPKRDGCPKGKSHVAALAVHRRGQTPASSHPGGDAPLACLNLLQIPMLSHHKALTSPEGCCGGGGTACLGALLPTLLRYGSLLPSDAEL